MIRKLSYLAAALMGIGLLATPSAYAATSYTWTFSPSGCQSQSGSGYATAWGNTCSDPSSTPIGGPALTAEGYADTGGGGTLQTAHSQFYSGNGIGINNRNVNGGAGEAIGVAPNHAIDNQDNVDSLLLSFTGLAIPVTLNSVTFGWVGSDADFDLLAYTGTVDADGNVPNSADPNNTANTYASLLTNGWQLVGQYSNSATGTVNVNSSGVTSSYWLVAADSAQLAGNALTDCTSTYWNGQCKTYGVVNDYFKVLSVAATFTPSSGGGHQNPAPEPGSLALLGVGSLLLLRIRAKTSKS